MNTWIWLTILLLAAVAVAAVVWRTSGSTKRLEQVQYRPIADWPAERSPTTEAVDVARVVLPQDWPQHLPPEIRRTR